MRKRASLVVCFLSFAGVAAAQPNTYSILYNFPISDAAPQCTLVESSPGVFFGTASSSLFSITSTGIFATVYGFSDSDPAGGYPLGSVIQASDGYLYGQTYVGGSVGGGAIFRSDLAGHVSPVNTDVYQSSPLVEGLDGNLYGVEGSPTGDANFFRLTRDGILTVLYDLGPNAYTGQPLILATDGNFYGGTPGSSGVAGVVYRVTPSGEYSVVHEFAVGEGVTTGLMQASNELIYGGYYGPSRCEAPDLGNGIFAVSLKGAFKDVYKYPECPSGAEFTMSGLVEADNGYLYGLSNGDYYNVPTIFQMALDGSDYSTIILCFGCPLDAAIYGPLFIQGSDGNFYGTTAYGGAAEGTVYEYTTSLPPPLPRITFFEPKSGGAGTSIRIKGSHLVGLSNVTFNGTSAAFASRGNDYATAVVPENATSGPITVTSINGSSVSKTSFEVK